MEGFHRNAHAKSPAMRAPSTPREGRKPDPLRQPPRGPCAPDRRRMPRGTRIAGSRISERLSPPFPECTSKGVRGAVHPHAHRVRRLSCSMTTCSRPPLGEYPTVVTERTSHATSVEPYPTIVCLPRLRSRQSLDESTTADPPCRRPQPDPPPTDPASRPPRGAAAREDHCARGSPPARYCPDQPRHSITRPRESRPKPSPPPDHSRRPLRSCGIRNPLRLAPAPSTGTVRPRVRAAPARNSVSSPDSLSNTVHSPPRPPQSAWKTGAWRDPSPGIRWRSVRGRMTERPPPRSRSTLGRPAQPRSASPQVESPRIRSDDGPSVPARPPASVVEPQLPARAPGALHI